MNQPLPSADVRLSAIFESHPMWPALFGEEQFEATKIISELWHHQSEKQPLLSPSTLEEQALYIVQKVGWHHQAVMDQIECHADDVNGGLDERPMHAYIDRLEARRAVQRVIRRIPITVDAAAALRPVTEAAGAVRPGGSPGSWSGYRTLLAYSAVCTDLRLSINGVGAGASGRQVNMHASHVIADIPLRLAKTLMGFVADAMPAIYQSAKGAPGLDSLFNTSVRYVNTFTIPALLRAHSALATAEGQHEELERMRLQGWGLLPECAHGVLFVMQSVCLASSESAPSSNPEGDSLRAQLAGEWRTVEHALDASAHGVHQGLVVPRAAGLNELHNITKPTREECRHVQVS